MSTFLTKHRRLAMAVGVTLGMLLAIVCGTIVSDSPEPMPPSNSPESLVERHLEWAEENCIAGVGPQVEPIGMFFSDARMRTRPYAVEVLGWDSKWRLVTDYFKSQPEHPAYMRERFEAMVFSQADLDTLVAGVVTAYLHHLDDVESQMLVRLEADLTSLSREPYSGFVDQAALSQRLELALRDAMTAAQNDLQAAVGREIVSWIASEVITQATFSRAASAGILGTGAASGTVTLGVGVIVGFIVDAIVTEIYNQAYDPAGELSKQLDAHLIELERLVVEGTSDAPGLVTRLRDFSSRRGMSRRDAIRAAVLPAAM